MDSLTLGSMIMSTMIFCPAYRTFPVFSSIDIIFIHAGSFFTSYLYALDFSFLFFKGCCCLRPVWCIFMPLFIDGEFNPIELLLFLLLFSFSSAHLRIVTVFPFYI